MSISAPDNWRQSAVAESLNSRSTGLPLRLAIGLGPGIFYYTLALVKPSPYP